MRRIKWAVFLFALVLQCAVFQELIQKPVVTYDGLSLKDPSLSQATLVFRLNVENPNPVGLPVREATYRIRLQEKEFLSGALENIQLSPQAVSRVAIPCTVQYLEFYQSLIDIFREDSLSYHLSGTMKAGPFSILYQAGGKVPLPKPPSIALAGIHVNRIQNTGARVTFSFHLQNRNDFRFEIQGLDFDLTVGEISLASGESKKTTSLENEMTTLDLPMDISFINLGLSAFQLLSKSSADYRLQGHFYILSPGGKTIPLSFQNSGPVQIRR
ncbi:MAG TPA: hypothetical protein ENN03_06400 [bacterium]|nr:hypothetical protein [bacterium]